MKLQNLSLDRNVQRSGRLVADKNLRLAGQCDCDNDTLSHTAGILERDSRRNGASAFGNSDLLP